MEIYQCKTCWPISRSLSHKTISVIYYVMCYRLKDWTFIECSLIFLAIEDYQKVQKIENNKTCVMWPILILPSYTYTSTSCENHSYIIYLPNVKLTPCKLGLRPQ